MQGELAFIASNVLVLILYGRLKMEMRKPDLTMAARGKAKILIAWRLSGEFAGCRYAFMAAFELYWRDARKMSRAKFLLLRRFRWVVFVLLRRWNGVGWSDTRFSVFGLCLRVECGDGRHQPQWQRYTIGMRKRPFLLVAFYSVLITSLFKFIGLSAIIIVSPSHVLRLLDPSVGTQEQSCCLDYAITGSSLHKTWDLDALHSLSTASPL